MTQEGFKRKLTSIFSADAVGYSRLMGDDEVATVRKITEYRNVISTLIKQHNGNVIDSPGDNLLAEFVSVVDAVQCAVAVQKELKARNDDLPENRRMQFRIGINLGDVIQEGDRIYGDGVNIAARLEGLAEPGGICISKTAFDHIESKLPYGYEFLGDQPVKNIAKPVGAYRVLMEPRITVAGEPEKEKPVFVRRRPILFGAVVVIVLAVALGIWQFYLRQPSVEAASLEKMAYPLPEKPSIAVLPFENLSGEPEKDIIAIGISENIITALSMIPEIFVISQSSSFTYKGESVKVKQVAEDLGVRYVLEGSFQKTGDQVRVTTQLIDAIKGHYLWADRYDRSMQNLFALQDEIAKRVAIELQVNISEGEIARISQKTDKFEAWGYAVRAYSLVKNIDRESIYKARALAKKAINLDPEYGYAWGTLAATYLIESMVGYSESSAESFKLFAELNKKALKFDPALSCALSNEGFFFLLQRQFDQAIIAGEKAITVNPSDDLPYQKLSYIMRHAGRYNEALTLIKKAMRHNPYYPAYYLHDLASIYRDLGRYEEALATAQQLFVRAQKGEFALWLTHYHLASIYMLLNRERESVEHAKELMKINPKFSLEWVHRWNSKYKDPADHDNLIEALRRAGIPEKSQ
ncbi:MAG: adenylate/guanylate cyclase domain-containing protein [Desulfobacterales bacterium]